MCNDEDELGWQILFIHPSTAYPQNVFAGSKLTAASIGVELEILDV